MCLTASEAAGQEKPRPVEFNRDIRPILSDACFHCHGPDKAKRKADVHFDTEEGARADLGGYFAIVPGKPEHSVLVDRITEKDPGRRMPPPKAGPALKPEQIALLKRWIEEGAKWQKHWAYIPPTRSTLPVVKDTRWARNPIDRFILARLEKEGFAPSPEAERATLIRRVSLDLTGLPPTPAEVDAFLADTSADAYERLVDRLLASPRFGERMAHRWLDAARYADTNGYQTDGDRVMWRWRDWVIDAFNSDMPFDRFTIEQIAGDMLPGATLEQKTATGFCRNHRGNSEGGVIPEEYAVEYVVDRVDTAATVFLGLTAGCAKCHSHKYDPLSQNEFYQLFAYFNNVPEKGKAIKYGNSPPYIRTPSREQEIRWAWLKKRLATFETAFSDCEAELILLQKEWEKRVPDATHTWTVTRGLETRLHLEGPGKSIQGVSGRARLFTGNAHLDAGDVGNFGFFDRFSITAWVLPEKGLGGSIASRMTDTDRADGYNLVLTPEGKLQVHLVKRWLDDAIRVESAAALQPGRWNHVAMTYDGSRLASGVSIYINGKKSGLKVHLDDLNQSFANKEPFRVGRGGGEESLFHGALDDIRIYRRVLSPLETEALNVWSDFWGLRGIGKKAPYFRVPGEDYLLRHAFLETGAPAYMRQAWEKSLEARQDLADFEDSLPTTMVMEEMPRPRDTHLLLRGEYDKKGPKIGPGLPGALPRLPAGASNNRLGLARWLVDRANPLTARVTVNRYWQMLFGAGIVKTVEDFGAQGEWPTHPELLDWLAVEFMEPSPGVGSAPGGGAWSVKQLLRSIVTSATYRQSSRLTKEHLARDPDNRLLARGPRLRLPAEIIRDQALFASGLLVEKIGGPSVRPYQPTGLVKELHGTDDYVQDHGPNLYRRSLYVYWKRTVPPPGLTTFDAAGREACVVRETRTNTPLQALNLLNDVVYVEAARVLAQRVMQEQADPEQRIALAFRLATSRSPSSAERRVLLGALDKHRTHFRANSEAARKLVATGEYARPEHLDVVELAAYAAVANTILNLDEVISKE